MHFSQTKQYGNLEAVGKLVSNREEVLNEERNSTKLFIPFLRNYQNKVPMIALCYLQSKIFQM